MEQLSLTERYFKERYRKFEETLPVETYSGLWPDTARHIARMKNNPSNPVETVMLIDWWSRIPPAFGGNSGPLSRDAHVFFTYRVQPEDLK
jgi:hypothetical protein